MTAPEGPVVAFSIVVGLAGLLAVALVAQTPAGTIWTDVDGEAVPFATDDEILDFLRTARVVSETPIGVGINQSNKLRLEKDGLAIHAIFREVEFERRHAKIGERVHQIFRDSYRYECAAYELSTLLGLNNVPPAAPRTIRRRRGSVQIWLAPTLDETAKGFRAPSASAWARQLWSMYVFDNLIFNVDRNAGNVLVDSRYKLWLIDHTRAFQIESELLNDWITHIDRRLWQRLVSLSDEEIRAVVKPHLGAREIRSLLERRAQLVAHIRKLVEERGENVVLY
jgi:hypothetical protein